MCCNGDRNGAALFVFVACGIAAVTTSIVALSMNHWSVLQLVAIESRSDSSSSSSSSSELGGRVPEEDEDRPDSGGSVGGSLPERNPPSSVEVRPDTGIVIEPPRIPDPSPPIIRPPPTIGPIVRPPTRPIRRTVSSVNPAADIVVASSGPRHFCFLDAWDVVPNDLDDLLCLPTSSKQR